MNKLSTLSIALVPALIVLSAYVLASVKSGWSIAAIPVSAVLFGMVIGCILTKGDTHQPK